MPTVPIPFPLRNSYCKRKRKEETAGVESKFERVAVGGTSVGVDPEKWEKLDNGYTTHSFLKYFGNHNPCAFITVFYFFNRFVGYFVMASTD